jgi:hypothetical protein
MTAPKRGDKVRVTYEAVYLHPYLYGDGREQIVSGSGDRHVMVPADATIEVIEPTWEAGDVVVDALGEIAVYTPSPLTGSPMWMVAGVVMPQYDSEMTKPLRKIGSVNDV